MKKQEELLNQNLNLEEMQNINLEQGLTPEQVLEFRKKYGNNVLKKEKKETKIVKFLKQFIEPMIILLIIAGFLALGLAIYQSLTNGFANNRMEMIISYVEPGIIFLIVIMNAIFGFMQESKAEKSIDALFDLTSPTVRVLRNNKEEIIAADEVVVGDIMLVEAGDHISADGILINASKLEIEESILTGESLPVLKANTQEINWDELENEQYQVFSGTSIINGRAKVLVNSIGMSTKLGKIATLMNKENHNLTPLQQKLAKLSKYIGIFSAFLCVVTFFVYIFAAANGNWNAWNKSILIAITLAIGTIPEGLVPIVTVILANSVKRLSKKNALIKKLPAAETLSNVSVICSDKTGTLTQNKMTVTHMFSCDDNNEELMRKAILCTDGTAFYNDKLEIETIGDPTETAIVTFGLQRWQINKQELTSSLPRVGEIPFDSDRKLMTVVIKIGQRYLSITKGAPDVILKRSKNFSKEYEFLNTELANQALRVIAVAYKEFSEMPDIHDLELMENHLTFVGLIGMIDPPRPEAAAAIAEAQEAGIKTVMITGDHANTAKAIAKNLKIAQDEDVVITGVDLDKMSDEELSKNIEQYPVYARVKPEDKIRIVKAWQSHNKVIAMTGDGVNDAPALKAADLGCAMGITGTDVSKQASDMILTDDNFATIISGVKEGRSLLNSIKKLMIFLFITNIVALLTTFLGIVIFKTNPLSALQILWINVVAETFPGIALGLNRKTKDLMKDKPLSKDAPIIDKTMIIKILTFGILISALNLTMFYLAAASQAQTFDFELVRKALANEHGGVHQFASAMTFLTMGITLSLNSIIFRSDDILFTQKWKEVKYVILAFLISLVFLLPVIYIPKVNQIFGMNIYQGTSVLYNFIPLFLAIIPLFINEVWKLIAWKFNK